MVVIIPVIIKRCVVVIKMAMVAVVVTMGIMFPIGISFTFHIGMVGFPIAFFQFFFILFLLFPKGFFLFFAFSRKLLLKFGIFPGSLFIVGFLGQLCAISNLGFL